MHTEIAVAAITARRQPKHQRRQRRKQPQAAPIRQAQIERCADRKHARHERTKEFQCEARLAKPHGHAGNWAHYPCDDRGRYGKTAKPNCGAQERRPQATDRRTVGRQSFDQMFCVEPGHLRLPAKCCFRFFMARCTETFKAETDTPECAEASARLSSLSLTRSIACLWPAGSASMARVRAGARSRSTGSAICWLAARSTSSGDSQSSCLAMRMRTRRRSMERR